jgi:hypothetical protein
MFEPSLTHPPHIPFAILRSSFSRLMLQLLGLAAFTPSRGVYFDGILTWNYISVQVARDKTASWNVRHCWILHNLVVHFRKSDTCRAFASAIYTRILINPDSRRCENRRSFVSFRCERRNKWRSATSIPRFPDCCAVQRTVRVIIQFELLSGGLEEHHGGVVSCRIGIELRKTRRKTSCSRGTLLLPRKNARTSVQRITRRTIAKFRPANFRLIHHVPGILSANCPREAPGHGGGRRIAEASQIPFAHRRWRINPNSTNVDVSWISSLRAIATSLQIDRASRMAVRKGSMSSLTRHHFTLPSEKNESCAFVSRDPI